MDRTRYAGADGSADPAAERFITQELVEYIDSHYRTVATPESRAIAGLSIGGFGALFLGLRHPDEFGSIGAFSAPLQTDPATWVSMQRLEARRPSIYLGCGVEDGLLRSNRRFAAWLQDQHVDRKYEEGPGGHAWTAWDWQLESFLKTLGWSG
jgi:enterochelin esterase-like enzyme